MIISCNRVSFSAAAWFLGRVIGGADRGKNFTNARSIVMRDRLLLTYNITKNSSFFRLWFLIYILFYIEFDCQDKGWWFGFSIPIFLFTFFSWFSRPITTTSSSHSIRTIWPARTACLRFPYSLLPLMLSSDPLFPYADIEFWCSGDVTRPSMYF